MTLGSSKLDLLLQVALVDTSVGCVLSNKVDLRRMTNVNVDANMNENCLGEQEGYEESKVKSSHGYGSKEGKGCIRPKQFAGTSFSSYGEIKFNIKEYRDDAFQMLMLMKRNQILTDVRLEVGKEIFSVHKVVLAAASPYFKAMFTGGLRESEMGTVKLQGVCPTVMSALICFMYSGEIIINERHVCQILSAATMFQLGSVIEACCSFLEQQLDASNAIGIASFAQQHGCLELYNKANAFIEQHFSEVSQDEEFLQLSDCQLIGVIRRDELNVRDEKDVYCAVLKWVMHDEEKRRPKMERILQAVRCQFLSPRFLTEQMKHCHLLRKTPACREYLAQIFQDLSLHKPPQQKLRTPNAPCVIYIVGGYSNRQRLDTLECYDVEECQWTELSKLPVARSGLGAAYLQGIFYAVGGRNILENGNYHDSNWVDSFDPLTNGWKQRAPMNYPRNRLGVAVLDGQLYAVGGVNVNQYHSSVEKFDPEDNSWTLVKPMAQSRMGAGVAVVNRILYVAGGYDSHDRLNSCESYHPERNQWNFIAPMKIPRSGAGICSIDNYLFVIGGFDGSHQLSSVEKYDTEANSWSYAAPLKVPRSAMTVSVWDSRIYVMGGYDGNVFLSSVEVFDYRDGVWREGKALPWGRSGHASASSYHPCLLHVDGK